MTHQILNPALAADDALVSRYLDGSSPEGRYSFVDAWPAAVDELTALAQLSTFGGSLSPDQQLIREYADRLHAEPVDSSMVRFAVFPWRRTVVRLPFQPLWEVLHTSRNRHLIDAEQQQAWASTAVGIAGLSIGSAVLQAAVMTGATRFRLTDTDTLSPSNLNRLARSVCDVGQTKLELAARYAAESNPYVTVDGLPQGYEDARSDDFIGLGANQPLGKLGVIIEEMDDIALKVSLRRKARAAGVPVVSATDMGNNVIIDVERFDLDGAYPVLHGLVDGLSFESLRDDPAARVRAAFAVVGDVATPAMLHSASQVGRTIASWPQLGATAMAAGGLAATVARLTVTGYPIKSGRYVFDVEDQLLGSKTTRPLRSNEMSVEDFLRELGAAQGG